MRYCEPPARVERCQAGQVQHIDSQGCEPVDPQCGRREAEVDWEVGDDAELAAALEQAGPGEVIRLGAGRYAGPVDVGGRALVGVCAGDVSIALETAEGTVVTLGNGGRLEGVTVTGGWFGVQVDRESSGVEIVAVEVRGAAHAGIEVIESSIRMADVVVRDIGPDDLLVSAVAWHGLGKEELVAELERVVVERVVGHSLFLQAASKGRVVVRDFVATDIGLSALGTSQGLQLIGGTGHDVQRVLVDGGSGVAIAFSASQELAAADLVARHLAASHRPVGANVATTDGRIERLVVRDIAGLGANLTTSLEGRPELEVADLLVLGASAERRLPGRGLRLGEGLRASLDRVVVDGVSGVGLQVGRSEQGNVGTSELELTDVVVRNTRTDLQNEGGHGLAVGGGNRVTVRRVRVEDNRAIGVVAAGWEGAIQTRLELHELSVLRTLPSSCVDDTFEERGCATADGRQHDGGGYGLVSRGGARLRTDGFEVRANAFVGVWFDEDSVVRADRGEITGNQIGLSPGGGPDAIDEWFGDDVFVFDNVIDHDSGDAERKPPQAPDFDLD